MGDCDEFLEIIGPNPAHEEDHPPLSTESSGGSTSSPRSASGHLPPARRIFAALSPQKAPIPPKTDQQALTESYGPASGVVFDDCADTTYSDEECVVIGLGSNGSAVRQLINGFDGAIDKVQEHTLQLGTQAKAINYLLMRDGQQIEHQKKQAEAINYLHGTVQGLQAQVEIANGVWARAAAQDAGMRDLGLRMQIRGLEKEVEVLQAEVERLNGRPAAAAVQAEGSQVQALQKQVAVQQRHVAALQMQLLGLGTRLADSDQTIADGVMFA